MKTNSKALEMVKLAATMIEVEDSHTQCIYCWSVNCGCSEVKEIVTESLFLNFNDDLDYVENGQKNLAV